ncbi:MAG: hypothetical protein C5B50_27900 [Verrucomicrobia bacterium]|nr:MAG: hypothetical protein C5B50_27900 [Verrucomicrobiota bacterium]
MHTNEHESGSWLSAGRFALILGGLIFASFPQVILGLQTFVVRDYGFFAYPLAYYQRECFWHGKLPLWNPYNNCGLPFLAQWNTMCLYPPALVYLLLPLEWSLGFFCLLHLFFAGFGMYFFAHKWTGNRLGAALAGLVFAFNGFTLNMLMWPSHIATLSWMPWVVLFVQRAWTEGGRMIMAAAFLGALQMLAGGPETILFTWLICLALWATDRANSSGFKVQGSKFEVQSSGPVPEERPSKIPTRASGLTFHVSRFTFHPHLWRFPLIVALVAGLAAAQLLPFLDLAAHSQRESGYADARWSLPGWGWANFLVPMVFGHVSNLGVFFQYDQSWTSSYFLGIAPLLLAILALWSWRSQPVRLLAIAVAIAFFLALGDQTPPGHCLRQAIPLLGLMTYPIKYVTVIVFAVPLLAAFGFANLLGRGKHGGQKSDVRSQRSEILECRVRGRLLWVGAILLFLIGAILIWAWRAPFPTDNLSNTLRNGLERAGFLVCAVLILTACWKLTQRRVGARGLQAQSSGPVGRVPSPGVSESEESDVGERSIGRLVQWAPLVLLVFCWLDVWTHEPNQNPTVPAGAASLYEPGLARALLKMDPQPEAGQSRAMLGPSTEKRFMEFIAKDQRVNFLAKRAGYFADCNLLDHVPKVNGFFSLYPRECGELASILYGSTNANYTRLEDFMGVSQKTAPGELSKWQPRDSFLPFATAGQRPVFLDDTNAVRALLSPNFDGRKLVFLPSQRSRDHKGAASASAVQLERFTPEQLDFQIETSEPCFVVLSQTYYHNWRAFFNGYPLAVLRANYAFQAVEVPGKGHLRLVYQDRAFQIGSIVSLVTLVGCFAGILRRRA